MRLPYFSAAGKKNIDDLHMHHELTHLVDSADVYGGNTDKVVKILKILSIKISQ